MKGYCTNNFFMEIVLQLSYLLFSIAQFTMNSYLFLNVFGFKHLLNDNNILYIIYKNYIVYK